MSLGNPNDFNGDGRVNYVDQKIFDMYCNPNSGDYQGNQPSSSGSSAGGWFFLIAILIFALVLLVSFPFIGLIIALIAVCYLVVFLIGKSKKDKEEEKKRAEERSKAYEIKPEDGYNPANKTFHPAVYSLRDTGIEELIRTNEGKVFKTAEGAAFTYYCVNNTIQLKNAAGMNIGEIIPLGVFINAFRSRERSIDDFKGYPSYNYIYALLQDERFMPSKDSANDKKIKSIRSNNPVSSKEIKSVRPDDPVSNKEIKSIRSDDPFYKSENKVRNAPIKETVYSRLLKHEGELFNTASGLSFTYSVEGDILELRSATGVLLGGIPVDDVEHAIGLTGKSFFDFKGFHAPSYLYALVQDNRLQ